MKSSLNLLVQRYRENGNDGLQVVLGPEAELVAEAMKQKVK